MGIPFTTILIVIILIWTFIYTISFGVWTWKEKNPLGAIMVFLVAFAIIALPIYTILNIHG